MKRAWIVAFAMASVATAAHANGRLPMAGQVLLSPRDPDRILLRTTFGIVVSRDRGASFGYVCEQAMHYGGAQDPPYALTPEGRILLVTSLGYVRGSADASRFEPTVPLRGARDLTVDFEAARTWVLTSNFERSTDAGTYAFSSRLLSAGGEGEGLDPQGGLWLPGDLLYETVEAVPGDPQRIVLSGAAHGNGTPDRAYLSLSRDGGEHFHRLHVPLEGRESSVYVAGIADRAGTARVFLRTGGGSLTPGRLLVGDFDELERRARRGEPAGSALREALRFSGPMLGFAQDRTGTVYAGGDDGIWRSTDDSHFVRRSPLRARCLAAREDELYACADEAAGFLLGRSRDGGVSFEPLLRLAQVTDLVPGEEIRAACSEELTRMRLEYGAPPAAHELAPWRLVWTVGGPVLVLGLVMTLSALRRRSRRFRAAR